MYHFKYSFFAMVVLLGLGFSACADPPSMLLIRGAVPVGDDCVASATTTDFLGSGILDLSVTQRYMLFPNVENMASATTKEGGESGASTTGNWGSLSGETNRILLKSALISYDIKTQGLPEELKALFKTTEIPISSMPIDPSGGKVTLQLQVLSPEQVQPLSQILQPDQYILIEVSTVIQGVTTGDRDVESNRFTFPITLCNQCLLDPTCSAEDNASSCYMGQDKKICTGTADDTQTTL